MKKRTVETIVGTVLGVVVSLLSAWLVITACNKLGELSRSLFG